MTNSSPQTVFVSGIFNILHPGHVRFLRFASEMGDRLVVGVLPDRLAGNEVTVSEGNRLESIQSLRMVSDSFLIEDTVNDTIRRLRPDVVVKGREHVNRENEELAILNSYGGKLIFSSGDSFFSSTDLIHREVNGSRQIDIHLPVEFMTHHEITRDRLLAIIEGLSIVRVLVVGDAIVDQYVSCHPLGMSREDPTLVVTPVDTSSYVGGAAIVAAHAASVGQCASLYAIAGNDKQAEFLRKELYSFGVDAQIYTDDGRPTTTKQRYRAGGKTLLRVSHLHQDAISELLQEKVLEAIERNLKEYDVCIFSDFNYGMLPQQLVKSLSALASSNGLTMAADSQSSSQVGDISRFSGMDLITPTEYEARVAVRNFDDGLVVLADQLRHKSQARNVLLTLAEDGVLMRGSTGTSSIATDRLPALNSHPVDVSGAGDSLLVISSMALACGASFPEAALLGSVAAALQVSSLGNLPLSTDELRGVIAS